MSDGINYVPAPDGYVCNELGQYAPAAVGDGETPAEPVAPVAAPDPAEAAGVAQAAVEPATLAEAVHAADALAGE